MARYPPRVVLERQDEYKLEARKNKSLLQNDCSNMIGELRPLYILPHPKVNQLLELS